MTSIARGNLIQNTHPKQIREYIRSNKWRGHTIGLAEGYVQANLVILPKSYAFEFLVFCQRNPKPCPILEVTDVGNPVVKYLAADADLRTDLPRYRVFKNGECVDEPENISDYWNKDLVGFLLGCSASFEYAIIHANIRLRHIELGKIPPVYVTNIPCNPSNIFSGPMVVSMRAVPGPLVAKAVQVTSRYPATHGGPVFIGDSTRIGIQDLTKPAYGEWIDIEEYEVPMFWGCGITPQAVALKAKPEFMITHFPGNMFISDRLSEELAV